MQHSPALLLDRLNLCPGCLSWGGHSKDKAEDALDPSVLQAALSGQQSLEKGQVGSSAAQQLEARLMPPGEHINAGINAERLMGSVNITGEKHGPRWKEANNSSSVRASTGTGKLVMAVGQRAEHGGTHLPTGKCPLPYLMVNHDPIPFPHLLRPSMTFYLLGHTKYSPKSPTSQAVG